MLFRSVSSSGPGRNLVERSAPHQDVERDVAGSTVARNYFQGVPGVRDHVRRSAASLRPPVRRRGCKGARMELSVTCGQPIRQRLSGGVRPSECPSRCGCGRVRGAGRRGHRGGGRWRCAGAGRRTGPESARCGCRLRKLTDRPVMPVRLPYVHLDVHEFPAGGHDDGCLDLWPGHQG